jgi:hypothetical protein
MKSWIWILCLCLWLPQAWAQKVQIFDAPGTSSGIRPSAPAPAPAPAPVPAPAPAAAPVAVPAAAGVEAGVPGEEKPPGPTQAEKDFEAIQVAVRGGATVIQIMRDPSLRLKLVSAYQKNPLSDLPEPLIRASVIGQFSQNPIGKWLIENVPALQNFFVEFIRDPLALGALFQILNHIDDLMFYGNVTIVLFFVMYFVRRQVLFTMESRLKRIFIRLCFNFIFWFGAYLAYSSKFGSYFEPTWSIFKKHFF